MRMAAKLRHDVGASEAEMGVVWLLDNNSQNPTVSMATGILA